MRVWIKTYFRNGWEICRVHYYFLHSIELNCLGQCYMINSFHSQVISSSSSGNHTWPANVQNNNLLLAEILSVLTLWVESISMWEINFVVHARVQVYLYSQQKHAAKNMFQWLTTISSAHNYFDNIKAHVLNVPHYKYNTFYLSTS